MMEGGVAELVTKEGESSEHEGSLVHRRTEEVSNEPLDRGQEALGVIDVVPAAFW